MNLRSLALAVCALAFSVSASAQAPDLATIARASGTPDIPGLKMVWLAPWGEASKAHRWRNIIVHQTEGPAGSARSGALAQSKSPTRRGDLLARTGGDEFCIVLPSSTLREGAMIARRILEVCRADAEACAGEEIPIGASIGVAQWTQEIGGFPDRLMAAADHALYAAKRDGKNRYAVYDVVPSLAPGAGIKASSDRTLRMRA